MDTSGSTPEKEREIKRLEADLVEKKHQLILSRVELLKALNIGDELSDAFKINLISPNKGKICY